MKYLYCLLMPALFAILLSSCEKDNDIVKDTGYSKGVYVVNEGAYNSNTGSVSFVDPTGGTIDNNIFEAANNRPLGDIVQSFTVVNDSLGFIVVNNSAKVEIIRLSTFRAITDPIQVIYPRYFMQVTSQKGYLSAGSQQGYLHIVDLNSYMETDSIKVGFGPETMLMLDQKAYVANSGGWSADSTISIINTATDAVEDTFYTAQCPVDMAFDLDHNIWVYCKGYTNYNDIETGAYLQKLNSGTGEILWQAKVGMALDYSATPAKCAVSDDGTRIYITRPDGVYEIPVLSPRIPDSPLISGNFYGLDVNPSNGEIYVFTSSFSSNGTMEIFDIQGNKIAEGTVGIGPNGAVFHL